MIDIIEQNSMCWNEINIKSYRYFDEIGDYFNSRRGRWHERTSWSEIKNPYDITDKTSVADIPWIQDRGWYKATERDGTRIAFESAIMELREYYSFAIPSEAALDTIKQYGPICEMGAGSGYWSKLLTERGVDIVAYDIILPSDKVSDNIDRFREIKNRWEFSEHRNLKDEFSAEELKEIKELEDELADKTLPWHRILHFPIRRCSQDFVPPADRTLFICWPPYDTPMANDILNRYKGDHFIYIGEGDGGCTGDEDFFKTLDEEWEEIDLFPIPNFHAINDWMWIYKRRSK